jgi:hypothetical protein
MHLQTVLDEALQNFLATGNEACNTGPACADNCNGHGTCIFGNLIEHIFSFIYSIHYNSFKFSNRQCLLQAPNQGDRHIAELLITRYNSISKKKISALKILITYILFFSQVRMRYRMGRQNLRHKQERHSVFAID